MAERTDTFSDDFSEYDEMRGYAIFAEERNSNSQNGSSTRIIVNGYKEEQTVDENGPLDLGLPDYAKSFRVYSDDTNARFSVHTVDGSVREISQGETVDFLDIRNEYTLYPEVYISGVNSETDVQVYYDIFQPEYVHFSPLEDFAPVNLRVQSRINYKTRLKWEPANPLETVTENLAYEIYRGETEAFEPDTTNLVATVSGYTYDEINTDFEGQYFYKVRAVELCYGDNGQLTDVMYEGRFSDERTATVIDADEYLKRLGIKEYWKYAQMGTPSGTAYVEKSEGNLAYQQTDVEIPGEKLDTVLTRTYNSRSTEKSMFGHGWSTEFDMELLRIVSNGNDTDSLVLKYGDGSLYEFQHEGADSEGNSTYASSLGKYVNLKELQESRVDEYTVPVLSGAEGASSNTETITVRSRYVVTDKNYNEYRFNEEGKLVYIGQPSANFIIPQYDMTTGMLISCMTNRGVKLLFEYNQGRNDDAGTVSRVLLPDGSSYEYAYEGDPAREDVRLTDVTHVGTNGGRIRFRYGYTGNKLNRITDGKGNVYEAGYDSEDRVVMLQDPEQKTLRLSYQGNGSRTYTACYDERGLGRRLLYNEEEWFDGWFGNCMKSVDAAGNVSEYAYKNNLLQSTSQTTSYQYISGDAVAFGTTNKYEITTYDANENPKKVVSDEGVTRYDSNANGDITSEVTVNSDGNESVREESEYDEDGNVLWTYDEIEDEGEVDTYYDEDSEFAGEPDTEYVVSENVTDESGVNSSNLISKTEYSYELLEGGGRRTTETITEDGVVTQNVTEVDVMGKELLQETRTGSEITSSARNTYDEFGRNTQTSVTNTRGSSTVTRTTSRAYDSNGTIVSETAEDGTVTSYSYDAVNRVIRETVTNGDYSKVTLTGYAYSDTDVSAGDGVSHTVENAYVTTKSVQGGDTSITWQNGAGNTVKKYENGLYEHSTFDRSGHEVCTYQAGSNDSLTGGMLTLNLFDSEGNNTATIQGAEFSDGAYRITDDSIVTRTEHDGNGNAVKLTDENGNRTIMTYDEKNQLTSLTQPGGQRSQFSYTDDGNGGQQIEALYAGGAKTVTRSNERGLEIEITDYDGDAPGMRIQKSYDAEGNLTREEELAGSYRTYSYNADGQVTEKKSHDSQGNLTLETDYEYNGDGRLVLQQDYQIAGQDRTLISSLRCTYDSAGRRATFKEWHGETEPQQPTGSYSYDAEDRVVRIDYSTDSSVSRVQYVYDQNGWLSEIKVNGHASREYDYDSFGRVIHMTDHAVSGNAEINRSYMYDQYFRVVSMDYAKDGANVPFEVHSYDYDKAGNITAENVFSTYGERGQDLARIRYYTYNSNGWLVEGSDYSADENVIDAVAPPVITAYDYDDAGNRISRDISGEITTSQYNQLNQLVSSETVDSSETITASVSYSYDSSGNLISQADTVTGESISMIYDAENRMTALEKSENGTEILQQTNVYNGDGQRIRKSESGNTLTQAETNRDYFYQDGTVLYTRDAMGQNDFNVIGSEGNIIASSRISGGNEDWFIYNRDIRGSVTSIYDSSEELAAEYDYDEYGNTNVLAEDGIENEFGYTGQIYDRNTGLYYYNARFYDSETGRFTSQDTYRGERNDADTYHLYAYCANNPINYVDPSGHKLQFIGCGFTLQASIGQVISSHSVGISVVWFNNKIKERYKGKETHVFWHADSSLSGGFQTKFLKTVKNMPNKIYSKEGLRQIRKGISFKQSIGLTLSIIFFCAYRIDKTFNSYKRFAGNSKNVQFTLNNVTASYGSSGKCKTIGVGLSTSKGAAAVGYSTYYFSEKTTKYLYGVYNKSKVKYKADPRR